MALDSAGNHEDIVVDDAVCGRTIFPASAMDDFVLVRSDGTPTYNFATVVDDSDMQITHVIRATIILPNTPRRFLVTNPWAVRAGRSAHLFDDLGIDGQKTIKTSRRDHRLKLFRVRRISCLKRYSTTSRLLGWSLDGETTIVPPLKFLRHTSRSRFGSQRTQPSSILRSSNG